MRLIAINGLAGARLVWCTLGWDLNDDEDGTSEMMVRLSKASCDSGEECRCLLVEGA